MANPFVHLELMANDVSKAKSFYGKLFDWKMEDTSVENLPTPDKTYTMIKVGEGTGDLFVEQDDVLLDQHEQSAIGAELLVPHPVRQLEERLQGVFLDEGEERLFVLEVVVEVADRHVELRRDVAHPGGLEAAPAEDSRGRVEDLAFLL